MTWVFLNCCVMGMAIGTSMTTASIWPFDRACPAVTVSSYWLILAGLMVFLMKSNPVVPVCAPNRYGFKSAMVCALAMGVPFFTSNPCWIR